MFSLGASRVVIGSLAYNDPGTALTLLSEYGERRVVLALDYDGAGKVRIGGWKKKSAGEESVGDALERFAALGFAVFLVTSVQSDGTLDGPDYATLSSLSGKGSELGLSLIASGGISCQEDLVELEKLGLSEAIIGKALYEGRIDPEAAFRMFNSLRM